MTSQNEQQASDLQGGQSDDSRNDSHLPECIYAPRNVDPVKGIEWGGSPCICAALRACEQRVRTEDDDYAYVAAQAEADGRRRGWNKALYAAREAVAALESNPELEIDWDRDYAVDPSGNTRNARVWLRDAVAAIDALRVEQPPPLPPSVGVPTTPMWPAQ